MTEQDHQNEDLPTSALQPTRPEEHQTWRLRLEDFQLAADAQGIYGLEREATWLFFVEGLSERKIAKTLGLKGKRVKELLDRGEAKLDAWEPPAGMGGIHDVIQVMRGPRRSDPQAPIMAKSRFTGEYQDVVLRSPWPSKWDFTPIGRPSDEQNGMLLDERMHNTEKR